MLFVLTAAAKQWIQDHPGQVPVMSEFRVGSGFGYFPTDDMTDLQGDMLYTGTPSGKILTSGVFLYEAVMDSSVGPFHWGEVGFYRNEVLFAIGSQSTQVWKAATIGSMTGNQAVISAYIHPSSELSAAEVGNSSNELNVHVVPNIAQLPPAHLAFPNVVIVPSPITPTLSVLATASGRSWSLVGWELLQFQGELVSATANTLTIGDDVPPPILSGEYIISILSGPASGLVRSAVAYDAIAKRFTLDQPLPFTPLAGDTVRVMQSRIASSVENLPPMLWQLDPNLVASDLNQLMDLGIFFSPLLRRDGSNGMLSALDMGGNKVFNLATPELNTDAATKGYVDEQISEFATHQDVEDAVSGLATESYVNSSIANLADKSYVSSEISAATAGLASETYVDSAVSTAVTGLATEAFATQAAADSVVGLASEAYVTAQVTGLASESYVDSAVSTATTGMATEAFVNNAVADLASTDYVDNAINGIPLADLARLDGSLPFTGDLDLGTHAITNLADPQSPQGAATKAYVDSAVADLASTTYVDSAVSTAVTGLATEAFATQAAADSVVGLASESYVAAQVAGLASEAFVESEITEALMEYATQSYVGSAVSAAVTGLATEAYVTSALVGRVTTTELNAAIADFATEDYVNSAVSNLVDQAYVASEISEATAGMATESFVISATSGLASEAFVTSAVSTAVSGLATEAFATQAAADSIVGLASESYVAAQVAGLASEAYVDTEIGDALVGYATEAYVDDAIENLPPPGVTESQMNNAIAAALTGYATESFVTTAISNIPTPEAIETPGGWTISEVGGNLVFRLNGVAKATLDTDANLSVEGSGEFLSLKYLSYLQEPAVNLGTITDSTIEIDPSNGTTVSFTIDVEATQIDVTLLEGQFVTLVVGLLQESTITWTDVVWADGIDPDFSIGTRNIVHLWRTGTTTFGTKIGEFGEF